MNVSAKPQHDQESRNVSIRVIPRSRTNSVEVRDDRLIVRVSSPPEKGKANAMVQKLLAQHFNVPKSSISIVRGKGKREKIVRIH